MCAGPPSLTRHLISRFINLRGVIHFEMRVDGLAQPVSGKPGQDGLRSRAPAKCARFFCPVRLLLFAAPFTVNYLPPTVSSFTAGAKASGYLAVANTEERQRGVLCDSAREQRGLRLGAEYESKR